MYVYIYIYIYRRRRFGAPRFFPDRTELGNLNANDHPTRHPHTIIHVCIGIVDGHGSLGSLGNQGCARPPSTAASVPWAAPIRRPEIFPGQGRFGQAEGR